MERLLREPLALVGWNILHPIQVSLKKVGKVYLSTSGSLCVHPFSLVFASATLVLG
jgi:hypothetical protein